MSKIKMQIENCYGIGKLEHEFEFTSDCPYSVVYAPNGTMKTSLTKTFQAYARGLAPGDLVYPDRESVAIFREGNGAALAPESVYVVDPENFVSAEKSVSAFLASEELKREYDAVYQELSAALDRFFGELKTVSQSSDCSVELREAFAVNSQETDLEILERIFDGIDDVASPEYSFKYNDIFDRGGKVREFLQKHRQSIEEYFREYNNVLTQSDFFKVVGNVVFGTEQADAISKSLKDNSFFKVGHKITLDSGVNLNTYEEFKSKYDGELARVVNEPAVRRVFDKIDGAIGKNKELRAFKAAIFAHNEYLVDLLDYDAFRKKVWYSYLRRVAESYRQLIDLYRQRKSTLRNILNRAGQEQAIWRHIIDLFNDRFHAPFKVEIENQQNVLVNHEDAKLKFYYCDDSNNAVPVERTSDALLGDVLSKGERRAFCLLQILFEIEVRKTSPLLLIFDDVADSFDYKNKYAIIEYIQDLSMNSMVRTIILTHNLDFYRTVCSRLGLKRAQNVFMATKDPLTREIKLSGGQFLRNLLQNWIANPTSRILLAMLPFVRNLIEYIQGDDSSEYLLLTSCLHDIKHEDPRLRITRSVLAREVKNVYLATLPRISNIDSSWPNMDMPWVDILSAEAMRISEELGQGQLDEINLENKVVLAMCIRLMAESFMEEKLIERGGSRISGRNRFAKLFKAYRSQNLGTEAERIILNRVSLMTPEQIHLNSFMYEPLVDMSIKSLQELYADISGWHVAL